jgi:hypothetical protein
MTRAVVRARAPLVAQGNSHEVIQTIPSRHLHRALGPT